MSQFRSTSHRQPFPAPYYNPSTERWASNEAPPPPAWPSYPPFSYHPSSREAHHDAYRQYNSYSPVNCSPEFYSVDRQLPNPYPSPTFSNSPPLGSTSDAGGNGSNSSNGGNGGGPSNHQNQSQSQSQSQQSQSQQSQSQQASSSSRERIDDRQILHYDDRVRMTAPIRHEPYRRPLPTHRDDKERERMSEKIKDGPCRPFVAKVAQLLSSPEKYGNAIRWDPLGTTFILTLASPVYFEMLKEMFQHTSGAAFSHQLNTYGFQRLTAAQLAHRFNMEPDPKLLKQYSAWTHCYFTREDPSTLNRLLPKPSRARATQQKEKAMRILMGSNQNDYDHRG